MQSLYSKLIILYFVTWTLKDRFDICDKVYKYLELDHEKDEEEIAFTYHDIRNSLTERRNRFGSSNRHPRYGLNQGFYQV